MKLEYHLILALMMLGVLAISGSASHSSRCPYLFRCPARSYGQSIRHSQMELESLGNRQDDVGARLDSKNTVRSSPDRP